MKQMLVYLGTFNQRQTYAKQNPVMETFWNYIVVVAVA